MGTLFHLHVIDCAVGICKQAGGDNGTSQIKQHWFIQSFPWKMEIVSVPSDVQFVQNTISPATGRIMLLRCSKLTRGSRNPLAWCCTSNPAEGSGGLLSTLIATWADTFITPKVNRDKKKTIHFIAEQLIEGNLTWFDFDKIKKSTYL
jgi:hypothetical protein